MGGYTASMTRSPLSPRGLALMAGVALLLAGGGTYAALRAQQAGHPARAAAAVQKAAMPVLETLDGKVGPAGLKKIKATMTEHSPSKAVERASRAVAGAKLATTGGAAAQGAKGQPGARRGGWTRKPFGRGAILERR